MHPCRVCTMPTTIFADYGRMPLANGFLLPEQVADERFYRLQMSFCPSCGMIQVVDLPDPAEMFHDHYAYFAQTSQGMITHFRGFAADVIRRLGLGPHSFVVEPGSNDGIMLRNFAAAGIRHLGVDPAANVAAAASQIGVRTRCAFFGEDTARAIRAEEGPADAIVAANVIAHIPDINSVGRGIRALLKDDGVFVFEAPYAGDVIQNVAYDQFYDEHIFLFSCHSVQAAFARHGLELFDAEHQPTHGGSMRYWLAPAGARPATEAVGHWLGQEEAIGLGRAATYQHFFARCQENRSALRAILEAAKAEGKRVVGYGATAKSTTVANFCAITPDLVEFICDVTPTKQDKLTPGMHIPVRPYSAFSDHYPDYAVLFAWSHAEEIFAKEEAFRSQGGRWITFVPRVEVV